MRSTVLIHAIIFRITFLHKPHVMIKQIMVCKILCEYLYTASAAIAQEDTI